MIWSGIALGNSTGLTIPMSDDRLWMQITYLVTGGLIGWSLAMLTIFIAEHKRRGRK